MATPKKTQIVITANAAVAKKVMDELQQRIDQIKQKMAALDVTTKAGQKEFKKLEKELVSYNSAVSQNITNTERIKKAMDNLSKTSLNELKRALSAAKSELGKMSASDPKLKQMQGNVNALQRQIDKLTVSTKKQGSAWETTLKNMSAYVTFFSAFNMLKQHLTGVLNLNFKLSDQLANIRKVSNLAYKDINNLSRNLAKIDTRTTVQELNNIAYAGAKLGIGNYGVEGLESFVRASNKVNVALKEDLGEDALTALSKFTEVMGLIPKLGVEQSMLKVGSAMFKLASTSTATAGNIVEFSKRLTGIARTAGITADQILALGSASDSMMLMPEVASTAFNKLITSLQRAPGAIEKSLQMPEGRINDLFKAGNAMEAIVEILSAMKAKGNMHALNSVFKDLGSDGARLIAVMVTMAKNVDMLKTHLDTAKESYEDGSAVTKEYIIQQETAQALLERANNMWTKAFVNPEGVDSVKELSKAWYDMSKYLTQNAVAMGTFHAAIEVVLMSVKTLIAILPGLMAGLVIKGAVAFWTALAGALNVASIQVRGFAAAWQRMNIAMKANWVSLAIGLVVELGVWLAELSKKVEKVKVKWDTFTMSLKEAHAAVAKGTIELNRYKTAIDQAAKGTEQRKAAISNFNKKFGSYLSQLITEKSTVQELAKAYNEAARAIEKKILMQFREKDIEKHVTPRVGWASDRLYEYDQAMGSLGLGAFGGKWLKGLADDYIGKQGRGLEKAITKLIKDSGIGTGYNEQYTAGLMAALRNSHGVPNGRFSWQYEGMRGSSPYSETRNATMTEKELAVARGIAFLRQQDAAVRSQQDIREKYKMYDLDSMVDNDLGDLTGDTGGNGSGLKPLGPERPETGEDPLTKAKKQLMEMRKNIMAFYEQQMTFLKEQMAAEGTFDPETAEVMLKPVEQQMYEAINALESTFVLGGNAWKEFNGKMGDHLKDAESFGLLNTIQKTDVDAIRTLANEGRPKGYKAEKGLVSWINKKGKETTGRGIVGWQSKGFKPEDDKELFLASMLYDSSRQENKRADISLKQSQKRLKELLEHDYTGKVQQESVSGLLLDGFATSSVETFEKDKAHIVDVLEKSRSEIVDILAKKGDREGILKILGIDDKDSVFKPLLAMGEQDFDTFYRKLIQYSDQYTEAQKKQHDEQKRNLAFLWEQKGMDKAQAQREKNLATYNKMYGDKQNFGAKFGMAYNSYDTDVEAAKQNIENARIYRDFVKQYTQDTMLIQKAEEELSAAQDALTSAMVERMKKRVQALKDFMKPTEQFIESMGDVWAEFVKSTEDGQKAMLETLKTFIKSYGSMLINNLRELAEKKLTDAFTKKTSGVSPEVQEQKNTDQMLIAEKQVFYDIRLQMEEEFQQKMRELREQYAEGKISVSEDGSVTVASDTEGGTTEGQTEGNETTTTDGAEGGNEYEVRLMMLQNFDTAVLEETANFHQQMLEEEMFYQEQLRAIQGGDITDEDKLQKIIDMHAQERALQQEQNDGQVQDKANMNKSLLKLTKQGGKQVLSEMKKSDKKEVKENAEKYGEMLDTVKVTKQGEIDWVSTAEGALTNILTQMISKRIAAKKQESAENQAQNTADVTGEVAAGVAGGGAKTVEQLGWWGIPLIAVISAALMALLNWALGSMGSSSNAQAPSAATNPKVNTKLVSGMLTYDSGNVSDLKPFFDKDGNMFWAEDKDDVTNGGINLLTHPTATTINGETSLVAEKGPELVIGRETTAAMMQDNPQLLKALYQYDKHHSGRTAYDAGNLDEFGAQTATADGVTTPTSAAIIQRDPEMLALMTALLQRLNEPIKASINMYGRDGLYESNKKAQAFMKNK